MLTVFLAILLTIPLAPLMGGYLAFRAGTNTAQELLEEAKASLRGWILAGAFWLLVVWANIGHWSGDLQHTATPLLLAISMSSGAAAWLTWLTWLDRKRPEHSLALMAFTFSVTTPLLAFSACLYWIEKLPQADWAWKMAVGLALFGGLVRRTAVALERERTARLSSRMKPGARGLGRTRK